jgi:hypothetical protein
LNSKGFLVVVLFVTLAFNHRQPGVFREVRIFFGKEAKKKLVPSFIRYKRLIKAAVAEAGIHRMEQK